MPDSAADEEDSFSSISEPVGQKSQLDDEFDVFSPKRATPARPSRPAAAKPTVAPPPPRPAATLQDSSESEDEDHISVASAPRRFRAGALPADDDSDTTSDDDAEDLLAQAERLLGRAPPGAAVMPNLLAQPPPAVAVAVATVPTICQPPCPP
eukprot:EG_transcript_36287